MGCGCGGNAGAGRSNTVGYYVDMPDGTRLPEGVNLENPEEGTPLYFSIHEANTQVTIHRGGTIRRLKREPASA